MRGERGGMGKGECGVLPRMRYQKREYCGVQGPWAESYPRRMPPGRVRGFGHESRDVVGLMCSQSRRVLVTQIFQV